MILTQVNTGAVSACSKSKLSLLVSLDEQPTSLIHIQSADKHSYCYTRHSTLCCLMNGKVIFLNKRYFYWDNVQSEKLQVFED